MKRRSTVIIIQQTQREFNRKRRDHAIAATARHTAVPFTAEDIFLTVSSVGFAVALFDTLLPLTIGATVCMLGDDRRRDIPAILSAISKHGVTAMFTTPQLGIRLLDDWHAGLRKAVFAGDAIRAFHAPGTRVFNAYGMSEFVMVGMTEIPDGQAPSLPLCRPFGDVETRIADETGRDVPEGCDGELWVRGPEQFCGYFGDPALTAQKTADGWFRSGDIVRRGPDGLLYFVNRSPDMIKLNGQNIAPAEVEAAAVSRCGLHDAICALKPVGGADTLCLYYTGERVAEDTLRRKLAEVLAPYMVPSIYIRLDKLPLNANMKVDRKALPDPETAPDTACVQPDSPREAALLSITRRVLGRTDFGVTNRLRRLGLTSLHAMTVIAEAAAQGIPLKLSDLIKFDTIRSLLNARMSVAYPDGGFDPARPTVVLACGITAYTSLAELCAALKERFNLFVIEPVAPISAISFWMRPWMTRRCSTAIIWIIC